MAGICDVEQRLWLGVCSYQLIDTGAFDGNRYWDVFVEYFKAAPHDILTQISLHNRSYAITSASMSTDGDTRGGVGASRQTGWTGLIAKLLQARAKDSVGGRQEVPSELREVEL